MSFSVDISCRPTHSGNPIVPKSLNNYNKHHICSNQLYLGEIWFRCWQTFLENLLEAR